jgi:hypothetical protein
LLIISMSFQVEGAYQPSDNLLMVIITYEDGDHDLGSEVPFKVHVLEDCEYVDADNVTVTSGYTHSWYDIDTRRDIEVHRTGTGLWEGLLVIQESDISVTGHTASIFARVEKGPINASRGLGISLVRPFTLEVSATYEDGGQYVSPGGSRTITWHTMVRGEHVDAQMEVRVWSFVSRTWWRSDGDPHGASGQGDVQECRPVP